MFSRRFGLSLTAAAVAVAAVASALAPAQAVTYAQIEGRGSTAPQVIANQWIAEVDARGMRVVYTGGGSKVAKIDFARSVTDFGVTDIPYIKQTSAHGRAFAYVPLVGQAVVFPFHLNGIADLNLTRVLVSRIFLGQITNWNDPAIQAVNPGVALPNLRIVPVIRSDAAATSRVLTEWLYSSPTSYFPKRGNVVGQQGSDQVLNFIRGSAGNGSIGFVEKTYAVNARLPMAKVQNASGQFMAPRWWSVRRALKSARLANDGVGTPVLSGVFASGAADAYPVSYVHMAIIPTGRTDRRMTTAKRQAIVDFFAHALCDTGHRYGFTPLPYSLVGAGRSQLAKMRTADPAVSLAATTAPCP